MLRHHSSRRTQLDQAVLNERLQGAVSYDRIAGYFRSSLFEIAGEAPRGVSGKVRIVCNADCDPKDLETAAAAQAALRRSWCRGRPEEAPPEALPRYQAQDRAAGDLAQHRRRGGRRRHCRRRNPGLSPQAWALAAPEILCPARSSARPPAPSPGKKTPKPSASSKVD